MNMKKTMARGFGLYIALAVLLVAGLLTLLMLGPRWFDDPAGRRAARRHCRG